MNEHQSPRWNATGTLADPERTKLLTDPSDDDVEPITGAEFGQRYGIPESAADLLVAYHAKGSPARAITARSALDTFLKHPRELRELCGYGTDLKGGWNTVVIGLSIIGQRACAWASELLNPAPPGTEPK